MMRSTAVAKRCCVIGGACAASVLGVIALVEWHWSPTIATSEEGPVLLLEEIEHDVGAVVEGTIVRGRFALRNVGTRRLVVHELSCSTCGQSNVTGLLIIEPGETGYVNMAVGTRAVQGIIRHVRHYTTSDSKLPRFGLSLTAKIIPLQSPAPTLADLTVQ